MHLPTAFLPPTLFFLLSPTLTVASNCIFTNNVIFFSYNVNLDNTSCDDQARLESLVENEGTAIPCVALTNGKCTPSNTGAIFSFNEAVFCGPELVQDAIVQLTGVTGINCG